MVVFSRRRWIQPVRTSWICLDLLVTLPTPMGPYDGKVRNVPLRVITDDPPGINISFCLPIFILFLMRILWWVIRFEPIAVSHRYAVDVKWLIIQCTGQQKWIKSLLALVLLLDPNYLVSSLLVNVLLVFSKWYFTIKGRVWGNRV